MIGIIIQARTGSTRLPKKMTLPFFEGKGIFETMLVRIKEAKLHIPVVLATTTNSADDILEKIALNHESDVFRGSEQNVLDRFIKAGEKYKLDKIIRVCADNPFLDMNSLVLQIEEFNKANFDYWCYALSDNTSTIKTHFGFWAEGVKLSALKKISKFTSEKKYLEHVTNYIYSNPNQFSIHFEPINRSIEIEKYIRLTIDTEGDFYLGQEIFNDLHRLNLPITSRNVLEYLQERPIYFEKMKNEITKNIK